MQKILLESVQDIGRSYLGTVPLRRAVAASGKSTNLSAHGYSSFLLRAVQFDPEKIVISESENSVFPSRGNEGERKCYYPNNSISFPWISAKPCMNGFQSVHGGSLCTLAETFSRMHVRGASIAASKAKELNEASSSSGVEAPSSSLPITVCLFPIHFDIRFLSATGENETCLCKSRIRPGREHEIISVDFSFVNERCEDVVAVGTQIFACTKSS